MIQFSIFGRGNTQIIQQANSQSLSALLVSVAASLKEREFVSDEVRDHFFLRIDEITEFLNNNHENTLETSKYMVFPFQPIPVLENLQDQSYICSMLDTLSVIAFTEPVFEVLNNYINIKIANQNIYGIYYKPGHPDLLEAYTRLLKDMTEKKNVLPGGFVCIPLSTSGVYALEEARITNIVTDIIGDSAYIKPLQTGSPKCLSLSSNIIKDAESLEEAQGHVREVLGIE